MKRKDFLKDLQSKNVAELNQELEKQLSDQFKLRLQKSTGQLTQTHLIRQVRRDIARIKSAISQKQAQESA